MNFKIFFLVLLTAGPVWATDYYVSPDGTASWPTCTTQDNPCKAGNNDKDFLDAQAGDTVYFLDGLYDNLQVPNDDDYSTCVWQPNNSGTLSNPITFKALNQGQVELRGLQGSRYSVNIWGSNDYTTRGGYVFEGFKLTAYTSGGSPIIPAFGLYSTNDTVVKNCELIGATINDTDNWQPILVHSSTNVTVEGCTIHGIHGPSHNVCGIKTYGAINLTVKNNYFYDNDVHVYFKGAGDTGARNDNGLVEYNYFVGGTNAILATGNSATHHDHIYRHNIFSGQTEPLSDYGDNDYNQNNRVVYNNTFYNLGSVSTALDLPTSLGPSTAGTSYNNIFRNTSGYDIRTSDNDTIKECDHNGFHNALSIQVPSYGTTYSSLSSWQSSGKLSSPIDVGCGTSDNPGCGSVVGDVIFENGSGNMTEIDDFYLASGSIGKNAGRDGNDMGANVALVGPGIPPAAQHTLTVTKDEINGTGTVTSSPAGINCGATCAADFNENSDVQLSATGDPVTWGGDCDSSGLVNMGTADKTCTATFTATPSDKEHVSLTGAEHVLLIGGAYVGPLQ